jgi:hypothetical protein
LCLTEQFQYRSHLVFRCAFIPGKLCFDMCFCQFGFQAVTHFVCLVLTFVNIITQSFFAFTVANLAGTVNHSQRAHDMVVTVFHAAFAFIRHMAVGTGYATLCMDTHHRQFIIRMLRFQNRCTAQFMGIVCETFFVIISLHVFNSKAFIPGESQILAVTLEIIFHMALRTNQ